LAVVVRAHRTLLDKTVFKIDVYLFEPLLNLLFELGHLDDRLHEFSFEDLNLALLDIIHRSQESDLFLLGLRKIWMSDVSPSDAGTIGFILFILGAK